MTITVNQDIHLDLVNEKHALGMYHLINNNREHLREWMMFIDGIDSVDAVQHYISETNDSINKGIELSFVIYYKGEMVGRIGLNKIDRRNKIGEINYWLSEQCQGKGIIILSCKTLIDYAFNDLHLNRIEIKCGVNNVRSLAIPKKLNFVHEGTIRQSKRLHDDWLDVNLYSLLKEDHQKNLHVSNNTTQQPPTPH